MDWGLILFRLVHVGSAMIWFGGAIIGGFFLTPTAKALGREGAAFMDHLLRRRRLGALFPIVATLTVLSGAALYWRDSGGLQTAWITSGSGLTFTVGGLAAIIALVGGFILIGPGIAAQTAVRQELAAGDGVPSEAQRERLGWADRRVRMANRIDLPLIILAGVTMAIGRYVQ